MRQHTSARGYKTVCLKVASVSRTFDVHRLVALAFLGKPATPKHVNHIDGDKTNNRADNLEWVSPVENSAHARANGLFTQARGERAGGAKLTEGNVKTIRAMIAAGQSQRAIAEVFGIGQKTVSAIHTGRIWRHVP
ncbi:hypothetical protein [Synechococcus phage Ssp-JY42]